jgi:predicted transcriptional regulator
VGLPSPNQGLPPDAVVGPLVVRVESEDEFFARVRAHQAAMATGVEVAPESGLSFESTQDFLSLITPRREALLSLLKAQGPFESIGALARGLGRDRGAVSKDVEALAAAGLLRLDRSKGSGAGSKTRVVAVDVRIG